MSSKGKDKGQAVAQVEEDANAVPAYLRDKKGSGLVGLDMSDFVVPRLKLLQGTSPEVTSHEDAKAGEFWLTVLDINIGKNVAFYPLRNKKKYLLIPPLVKGNDKGAVFARAEDGRTWDPPSGSVKVFLKNIKEPVTWEWNDADVLRSGLAAFGTSKPDDPDSKPAATLFYDYLIRLKDFPEVGPILFSFARSTAKSGKDLQGKIELRNKPMESQCFMLKPFEDQGDEGAFFNLTVAMNGWASEEVSLENEAYRERFKDFRSADEGVDTGTAQAGAPVARGDI